MEAEEVPTGCPECQVVRRNVRHFDQLMAQKYGVHLHSTPLPDRLQAVHETCETHGPQPTIFGVCCECALRRFVEEGPYARYRTALAIERNRRAASLSCTEQVALSPAAEELSAFQHYGVHADQQASYMENQLRAAIAIGHVANAGTSIPPLLSPGQFAGILQWMTARHGAVTTSDPALRIASALLLVPVVSLPDGPMQSLDWPPAEERLDLSGGALAQVRALVSSLPTDALRHQLFNCVGDRSDADREMRVETPEGQSAPLDGIPEGWINPHSFEWLWDLKPGVFNHSPPAAQEFAREFRAISGVIGDDERPVRLPALRHAGLFVIPASVVRRMAAIVPRSLAEADGTGRPARPGDRVIFVSHRWDGKEQPDPSGMQLKCLQSLSAWLEALGHTQVVFWYDYWSVHQSPVTDAQRRELEVTLLEIPEFLRSCTFFRCPGTQTFESHLMRGWCMLETALSAPTVIPGDDNVGAMLRNWLVSTPAGMRVALVAEWERIWAPALERIGGFDDARILAWLALSHSQGDPMQDNAEHTRRVLADLVEHPLPPAMRTLMMRCTVPGDADLVLTLWTAVAGSADRRT